MTIAVIIPTLDAAATLARTLDALAGARRDGIVAEVIVSDGGSHDTTRAIAAAAGARWLTGAAGRGRQIAAGVAAAAAPWLLLLHADTRPEPGWEDAVARWLVAPANVGRAAYFRLRLDDGSRAARRLERIVAWRARHLGLPYGDQGLLIAADHLERLGGVRPLPLMEDVDLVRRIGRRRLDGLAAAAVTSAVRYRRDGWVLRPARNLACLALYFLGVPPAAIRRLYG